MILGIIFFPNFSDLSIFIPAESLAGPDGPALVVSNLCTPAIQRAKERQNHV